MKAIRELASIARQASGPENVMPTSVVEIPADSETVFISLPITRQRRWLGRLGGIAAVTLLIAFARFEIIESPPYYDFVIGIWPEAQFLADSNFDYWRLRYEENHSLDRHGGKRSYMTSVVPSLLAVALKFWPDSLVPLVIYHWAIFFCAAVALVLLYEELLPVAGRWGSLAVGLAVATTPVFAVQMDMTGMEMPLIAALMASLVSVSRGRGSQAALMTLLAFLIKPTGLLATVILLALLTVQRLTAPSLAIASSLPLRRAITVSVICLGIEIFLLRWGSSIHAQLAAGPPIWMLAVWSPDVVLLSFLAGVCLVWLLLGEWTKDPSLAWKTRVFGIVTHHRRTIYAAGFAFAVLASLESVRFVPRYVACTVPFLYFVIAETAMRSTRLRPAVTALLAMVSMVNLLNWNGALYPDPSGMIAKYLGEPAERLSREGSFLERSHEYLIDHRQNQEVVRYLEKHCQDEALVVGIPFAYFLAYPCMGYVRERMPAYVINGFVDGAPEFRDASELLRDLPPHPVFVVAKNGFYHDTTRLQIPEPREPDEILIAPGSGGPVVFRKGWDRAPSDRLLSDWYMSMLWPEESEGARAFLRARSDRRSWERIGADCSAEDRERYARLKTAVHLGEVGMEDLAAALFVHVVSEMPDSWAEARSRLAGDDAAYSAKDRHLDQELARLPPSKDALLVAAELCLQRDACRRAIDFLIVDLQQRISLVAEVVDFHESAAAALWRGDYAGAERIVRQGITLAPRFSSLWCQLGELMLMKGAPDEAARALHQATKLAPSSAQAHYLLGLAQLRQGKHHAGMESTREAVRLDPFHSDAINTYRKLSALRGVSNPRGASESPLR